ncbi:hypothetical protein B566_EDAN015634, partial [Ephemera danica]
MQPRDEARVRAQRILPFVSGHRGWSSSSRGTRNRLPVVERTINVLRWIISSQNRRCRDFYICRNIGSNHFQQFLGECLPDHIFNVMKSECIVDVGDGCSLYTTSSCSSTTIEMTTINIPSSTFSITNTFPETEKTTPVTTHVTTTQEPT